MQLKKLVQGWADIDSNKKILGLQNDSRLVKPGDLFLAYPGLKQDGRFFIQQALAAGANAVLYESKQWPSTSVLPDEPCFPIENLSQLLAKMAARFYHYPSQQMQITGVTGTNGKTTIAYQLAQAHHYLHTPATYIGTLGQGVPSELQPLNHTTPDAISLQQLLAHYHQLGHNQVCMEVSSHALVQQRVAEINFTQAIFTNLTWDHLDYHQTMENYAAAKALLFAYPSLQYAIINQDDNYAAVMKQSTSPGVKCFTYGIKQAALIRAIDWQVSLTGTAITVDSPWGKQQLFIKALGYFNIYNALALFTSLALHNYPMKDIIEVIATINPAPGRMQVVAIKPYIIIDYAHTPDALENVLNTLLPLKKNHLVVVFGCGGERDKVKRGLMGEIAVRYADKVVITSDNPRNENPMQIIEDILSGINSSRPVVIEVNRKQAIIETIEQANDDDIIIIAGKGHENYQQIGDVKYAFSDQAVIETWLNTKNNYPQSA